MKCIVCCVMHSIHAFISYYSIHHILCILSYESCHMHLVLCILFCAYCSVNAVLGILFQSYWYMHIIAVYASLSIFHSRQHSPCILLYATSNLHLSISMHIVVCILFCSSPSRWCFQYNLFGVGLHSLL